MMLAEGARVSGWFSWIMSRTGSPALHRWELPVGNYHGNSGNYHYPFFWVIFMVILHFFYL